MEITEPKSLEISKLTSILDQKGIFKIDSYLTLLEIDCLKSEVLKYHKTNGKSYPFGSTYAIENLKSLSDSSLQIKVFSKPWMKELFLKYNNNISKGFFTNIYSTYDYKNSGELGRNGFLHFDRNASLKFFLYLNDVTKENGAFYIQPGSHKLGKKLREKAWGKLIPTPNDNFIKKISQKFFGTKFNQVKNRIEIDYPELYDSSKLIPVEGKAGTLIVFDSDIFHLGGLIEKKGLERLVLRMHSYLSK